MAGCCGLSKSQIENILHHSHARNNRAVVFSICAALIIHTTDIVLTESPELKDKIESMKKNGDELETGGRAIPGKLESFTTTIVTSSTTAIGRLLREKVATFFTKSCNGKHFVDTALFTCFLPVVGFHVLPRTGHSDVVDSFWLRLNNVLHASGHLNYQQLYMFYGFFRGTMPRAVFRDIYTDKPGGMVARVPSFTSGMGSPYDKRGWTYVHLDESLEMLIVRLLKSLNVTMLPYLENAGAWLLMVSRARMLIRTVTAASRAYRPVRGDGDADADVNPPQGYDRFSVQSASVRGLVNLMRRKGFLSGDHRTCERLKNVFGASVSKLRSSAAQNLIVDIDKHGQKSAELHASAMFPDVFGDLSDEDIALYLNNKRPRGEWSKQRKIPTAGCAIAAENKNGTAQTAKRTRDPKTALSDRRHALTKLMNSLTLAEHKALEGGDLQGAEHARKRWVMLHSARHLLSSRADAYKSSSNSVRHDNKSQIISALNFEFLKDAGDALHTSGLRREAESRIVCSHYDYPMPRYASVMFDLMNHIWSRGTDGTRGSTLFAITFMKMKQLLRPWYSGRSRKADAGTLAR